MKKNFLCFAVLMILLCCTMMACSSSCEHEWNEVTLDTPKTCAKCQETEGLSIRDMLIGNWIEEGSSISYICIEFTDTGFKGNMVLSGEKKDWNYKQGTVELDGQYINLWIDGKHDEKYSYFTYEILADNTIKLVDYNGEVWVKTDVLPD